MAPRTNGSQPPPAGPPGITMLGARQTGKTTFLAALQIALLRKPDLGWSLRGENPGSTKALIDFVNDMSDNHVFPQATNAIENYRWSLEGEFPKQGSWEWHRWPPRRRDRIVSIPLDLVDAPGESADGRQMFGPAVAERLVENLAQSSGIVVFYDPVSEF